MAGPGLSTFEEYLAPARADCPRLVDLPAFADREKRDLLASATLVAQPSRVESLGLVLLEAWANRKPVIVADIEVSRQLVGDSGGGITVPFGDAERLANALENMLSDPAARASMGAGGYQMARQYQGEAVWQKITAQFESVIAAYGRRN
jgi:glycosyltransferase involved in cell wall biosynthesis